VTAKKEKVKMNKFKGFTLIEVLVTLVVTSAALFGFVELQHRAQIAAHEATNKTFASIFIRQFVDEIKANPTGPLDCSLPLENSPLAGYGTISLSYICAENLEWQATVRSMHTMLVSDAEQIGSVGVGGIPNGRVCLQTIQSAPARHTLRVAWLGANNLGINDTDICGPDSDFGRYHRQVTYSFNGPPASPNPDPCETTGVLLETNAEQIAAGMVSNDSIYSGDVGPGPGPEGGYCHPGTGASGQYAIEKIEIIDQGDLPFVHTTNGGQVHEPHPGSIYSDFTGEDNIYVESGSNYSGTLTVRHTPTNPFRYGIWVDWDNDGAFETHTSGDAECSTEMLAGSVVPAEGSDIFTREVAFNLEVPGGVALGEKRLRVGVVVNPAELGFWETDGYLTPCTFGYQNGEVEDYQILVGSPVSE
jgi:prepilin-type N-terminal cleavage/methylation domain-containing protein|tara:strand:+ start:4609 stop:5862 length:1254 start_codon:yes stop_codon:yes gene_type:complete